MVVTFQCWASAFCCRRDHEYYSFCGQNWALLSRKNNLCWGDDRMMTWKQFTGWKSNDQCNRCSVGWHWREEQEQSTHWLKFLQGAPANQLEYQNNHTQNLNRLSRYID
jgi:hypothetical protein